MNRQRTTWGIALSMIAGVTLASMPYTVAATEQEKHFSAEYSATAETQLELDSGVGSIEFQRTDDATIRVKLKAYKNGDGVFNKDGNVADAELVAEQSGDRLLLKVPKQDGIQLDWVISLPQISSVDADLGVGEIKGDLWASDINIDMGVGDIDLVIYGDYRSIKTDVGVGDSAIRGKGHIENNRFLMTANSKAESNGNARINIDNGVGDIDIQIK